MTKEEILAMIAEHLEIQIDVNYIGMSTRSIAVKLMLNGKEISQCTDIINIED